MADADRTLYLVDGTWIIFRAFHVLPPLSNSKGTPTGATYGFIRMLLKLLKDVHPTHIGVVFDAAGKTFRDDLFAPYKANRAATPPDLSPQIPYIHRAVAAMRIRPIVISGVEADDVIGTLAARAASAGMKVIIVTGDKDFKQLVTPAITLWDTMNDRRVGVREVREQFGVEPPAVVDIMALTGDAIDNVKGLPGVGPKTASALIQHFGSLDSLLSGLDRLGEVKGRIPKDLAERIAAHRGEVELARKLVRIETDVPVDFGPEDLTWPGIDADAMRALLTELEFHTMLAELGGDAGQPEPSAVSHDTVHHVTHDGVADALRTLRGADRLAVHLLSEPAGSAQPSLAVKAEGDDRIFVFSGEVMNTAVALLAEPKPPKTCHDLKRHLRLAEKLGSELNGVDFDTMLAGFLVNPAKPEPSLEDLARLGSIPAGAVEGGGAARAVEAARLALAPRLHEQELERLFNEIEIPVARVLARMEAAGIAVDAAALDAISAEFGGHLERLERQCHEMAGAAFNLNSPNQLREILFDRLKLTAKGLKKTKSGYSTDADALEKLAAVHPLPRLIMEYRALSKLKSTYSDALPALIDPADGRLHTNFHQALTATGRLSSTEPNLQNIPTRSEEGRRIRRAFVAPPGFYLLSADYSQIDLRILAHLSGDATLLDAFARGEDIHARTASELLGVAPDRLDPESRRLAKVINFGIIYGMGPQRLASELGISQNAASDYIKRYFERLPGVREWFEKTLAEARERGFVATMYGRRRYLPDLNGPQGGARAQAERIAINTPIQGGAADLIKLAMVRLDAVICDRKLPARILLQVHDELLLEVATDSLAEAGAVVRRAMEGAAELRVPLRVELKSGPNWAELISE
jgi:DNA polymerase-1